MNGKPPARFWFHSELVYVGGRLAGYGTGIFKVLQPGEAKSGRPPVVEAAYLR